MGEAPTAVSVEHLKSLILSYTFVYPKYIQNVKKHAGQEQDILFTRSIYNHEGTVLKTTMGKKFLNSLRPLPATLTPVLFLSLC
jgi:hypothetical protein